MLLLLVRVACCRLSAGLCCACATARARTLQVLPQPFTLLSSWPCFHAARRFFDRKQIDVLATVCVSRLPVADLQRKCVFAEGLPALAAQKYCPLKGPVRGPHGGVSPGASRPWDPGVLPLPCAEPVPHQPFWPRVTVWGFRFSGVSCQPLGCTRGGLSCVPRAAPASTGVQCGSGCPGVRPTGSLRLFACRTPSLGQASTASPALLFLPFLPPSPQRL